MAEDIDTSKLPKFKEKKIKGTRKVPAGRQWMKDFKDPQSSTSSESDGTYAPGPEQTNSEQSSTSRKLLSEKFGSNPMIRLSPQQKRQYKREGFEDVKDFRTVLAPGFRIKRGTLRAVYGNEQSSATEGQTGIGDATPKGFGSGAAANPDSPLQKIISDFKSRQYGPLDLSSPVTQKQPVKGKGTGKINTTPVKAGMSVQEAQKNVAEFYNEKGITTPKIKTSTGTTKEPPLTNPTTKSDWSNVLEYNWVPLPDKDTENFATGANENTLHPIFRWPLNRIVNATGRDLVLLRNVVRNLPTAVLDPFVETAAEKSGKDPSWIKEKIYGATQSVANAPIFNKTPFREHQPPYSSKKIKTTK